jgi:hypothetical protein
MVVWPQADDEAKQTTRNALITPASPMDLISEATYPHDFCEAG